MSSSPHVSIVVPNYNYAAYLEQRLQSILNQSYQDFEIILLDDASTDDSREVIARYANNPRIRILINETNSGSAFNQWNRGVSMARGELVWIAESDDYADSCLLESLVRVLEANPSVGLAYCQSYRVDSAGDIIGNELTLTDPLDKYRWQKDFINGGQDECRKYLIRRNTIPNASAVVFRRALYQQVGGADGRLQQTGDWQMWAKLLLISDVAFFAQPLNFFRQHETLIRRSVWKTGRQISEFYSAMNLIANRVDVDRAILTEARMFMRQIWLAPQNFRRWGYGLHLKTLPIAMRFDPAVFFTFISATIHNAADRVRVRKNGLVRRLKNIRKAFRAGI